MISAEKNPPALKCEKQANDQVEDVFRFHFAGGACLSGSRGTSGGCQKGGDGKTQSERLASGEIGRG